MKKEDFPISSQLLEQFVNCNKKIWKERTPNTQNKKYILVNLSMVRMQIPWILPKLLFAKGLEEKTGAIPVVLTWNANEQLSSFFESFGVIHIALNKLCVRNITGTMAAFFKTVFFVMVDGTGEGLKKMTIWDLPIGKSLYEDILRTSSLSTIRSCKNKIVIKKIFHLLLSLFTLKKYCRKHPMVYAITDDMAYHEGMFIQLLKSMNTKIIACSNIAAKKVEFNADGEIIRHNWYREDQVREYIKSVTEEEIVWVDNYLEERFQGKNGREIDRQAFSGKKVLTKDELVRQYGMDPQKKTIVIMAHTFTDAVFNYGDYYFRDYYDWTEQTLKIASGNTKVNWILKPHPTRGSYNETEDSIEKLFAKYQKGHMYFLADDVSSESIKNIADVLVTIGGNAGAEYACFGIPAVIVGKPYYHGQGYTIEPKTFEEYKYFLEEADTIEPLSEEQMILAKKVFFFKNGYRKEKDTDFRDEFSDLLNEKYAKMTKEISLQYFKSNEGTKEYNDQALQMVYEYMQDHDLRDSQYYKRAVLFTHSLKFK